MKRNLLSIILLIFISVIILVGCGGTPSSPTPVVNVATQTVKLTSPTVSVTPDPCSPGQIEAEVQKVHRHMREFDDASVLASHMPREQLSTSIADLQRIRREAEDEQIPACLTNLKSYQVDHMNTVINTLVAFMGGANEQTLEQGINVARQQHDQYTLELARLLGLTVVPATAVSTSSTPSETPTP